MPVPFEALLPFGLVTFFFGVGGTLFGLSQRAQNNWQPPRYGIDPWDEVMMRRDKLLTGHARVQTDQPIRPHVDELRKNFGLPANS